VQGYGYEITGAVWDAYLATLGAAERHGSSAEVKERVRKLIAAEHVGGFSLRCSVASSGCERAHYGLSMSKLSAFAPRGHGSNLSHWWWRRTAPRLIGEKKRGISRRMMRSPR
jgi:hypothetical protein